MCAMCMWVPLEVRAYLTLELELQVLVKCWIWVLGTSLGPLEEQDALSP